MYVWSASQRESVSAEPKSVHLSLKALPRRAVRSSLRIADYGARVVALARRDWGSRRRSSEGVGGNGERGRGEP